MIISLTGSSANVAINPKCLGRYTFVKFKASAVCFTDPLTTGRFVGIMTTKQQSLQLCEVGIYSRGNWFKIDNKCDKDVYVVELVASLFWKDWLRYYKFIGGLVHKLVKKGTRPVLHNMDRRSLFNDIFI